MTTHYCFEVAGSGLPKSVALSTAIEAGYGSRHLAQSRGPLVSKSDAPPRAAVWIQRQWTCSGRHTFGEICLRSLEFLFEPDQAYLISYRCSTVAPAYTGHSMRGLGTFPSASADFSFLPLRDPCPFENLIEPTFVHS